MRPHRLLLLLALVPTVLALGGCKITGDDIEYWKGTIKGPGKIKAVMLSDKYPIELRTQAALAFVEMDREDVEEIPELQHALQQLEPDMRTQIIDRMVPELERMLAGGDTPQDQEAVTGAPPEQIQAKEAAFLLIAPASPDSKKRLANAVVDWFTVDFNGRSLAGNSTAETVIRSLGPTAAAKLVEALNAKLPQPAMVKLAELISQVGNDETKAKAAQRLVDIEKEIESDAYKQWLKDRIVAQARSQNPDAKLDEGRLEKAVTLNRESFIVDGALPAMKYLAGQDVIADRLLAIASTDAKDPVMVERRKNALLALEGKAQEKHLDRLLQMALDNDSPVPVRDYAFDRVGDIGSKRAIAPMWALVSGDDERLRWRAGELVLAIGGNDVVGEFFSKLPSDDEPKYAREELEGYATRMAQMSPPPIELLRNQLKSPNWWDRVIALRFLERRGTQADVARMRALQSDSAGTKGPRWTELKTVGAVAKDAVKSLQERLAGGKEAGDQG